MKKELMVATVVVIATTCFASGFWTGRKFPTHHYEFLQKAAGNYWYIDTNTGKVCDALKPFIAQEHEYEKEHPNPSGPSVPQLVTDRYDYMMYIPPCGRE